MRMRRIILSAVTRLAVPYVSMLFHNDTIFGEKFTEHKMRVLIFTAPLSETFLIM
jgi:hypothetical protein